MKLFTLILVPFVLLGNGVGQVNQTMQPHYDSYTTYAYDPNSQVVSQTVVVEGTTTGGCTQTITVVCGPNGQTCTYQQTYQSCLTATHTPTIKNVLGGVGGTTTGPAFGPFAYMSYHTTTQRTATPGQIFKADVSGIVTCSAIGTIFGNPLNWEIEIAYTLLKMSAVQGPGWGDSSCYTANGIQHCQYQTISWCTATKTPPDYNPLGVQDVFKATYPTYYPAWALCERPGAGFTWTCIGVTPTFNGLSAPDNYPKADCTKS